MSSPRSRPGGRPDEVADLMTFVVVGAGPTGVEMAGQLVELSKRTLRHDFRHIKPGDARIVLLDAAPAVLGSFHPRSRGKTKAALERMGVDVRLGAMVTDVDERGITVRTTGPDGQPREERIGAVTRSGQRASPRVRWRNSSPTRSARVDRAGRIPVQPDLTSPATRGPRHRRHGRSRQAPGSPRSPSGAHDTARRRSEDVRRRTDRRRFTALRQGSMATISPLPRHRRDRPDPVDRIRRVAGGGSASTWSTSSGSSPGSRR